MAFCTKCGNEVADGTKFCPKCGGAMQVKVSKGKTSVDKAAPKMVVDKKIIIGAVVLVALILIISGASKSKHKKYDNKSEEVAVTEEHGYADTEVAATDNEESMAFEPAEAARQFLESVPYSRQGLINKMIESGYSKGEAEAAANSVDESTYEHNAAQAAYTAAQLGWVKSTAECVSLLCSDGYLFTQDEAKKAIQNSQVVDMINKMSQVNQYLGD